MYLFIYCLFILFYYSGCGGLLQGSGGEFSSPGFPSSYPKNIECEWLIRAKTGYHVKLEFVERFYIELSNNCTNDYVEVIILNFCNNWLKCINSN